jgi:hypothetical protein
LKSITRKFWARRRFAPTAWSAVVATCFLFALAPATAQTTLQVASSDTLPGFHIGDLPRYLAEQMAKVRLSEWRFDAAAPSAGPALNRVEWSFKLNPYAGGEQLSFVRPHMAQRMFGAHRPVTIEARLYLNSEYQTLVGQQATIEGGPEDPDLAAAVAQVTRNLLGPQGAYPAIESRQPQPGRPR